MAKKFLILRVEASDHDAWKARARKAGLNLSEWIRRQCNAEAPRAVVNAISRSQVQSTGRIALPERQLADFDD